MRIFINIPNDFLEFFLQIHQNFIIRFTAASTEELSGLSMQKLMDCDFQKVG